MDFLEKLANAAKAANVEMDEEQTKLKALAPHFATEEAALEYAQHLTQLKPGDKVRIINPNIDGYMNAIFIGMMDGENLECAQCLFYNADTGTLRSACVSLATVKID